MSTPPCLQDLSGSIVVLTHARTGSSLLMQTLRLLGADVIGDFARPDLQQSANPKGYFEDRDMLREGLYAPAVVASPGVLRGRAVKLALRPLVERRSRYEWTALAQPDARLLLPLRSPAESLKSREVFLRSADALSRRRLFQMSARNRLLDFGFLAEQIGGPAFPRRGPVIIDYGLAIDNPAAYAALVASAAALQPSPAQMAAAAGNIDRSLYRVRVSDDANGDSAAGVRPLERVYDILRAEPDPWPRLREHLPPWVREAGRAPLVDYFDAA